VRNTTSYLAGGTCAADGGVCCHKKKRINKNIRIVDGCANGRRAAGGGGGALRCSRIGVRKKTASRPLRTGCPRRRSSARPPSSVAALVSLSPEALSGISGGWWEGGVRDGYMKIPVMSISYNFKIKYLTPNRILPRRFQLAQLYIL